MSKEDKKLLEQQLWSVADTLRGKMHADEFRDYILGLIFYKYLSEKMEDYANKILAEDNITYFEISGSEDEEKYIDVIKEEAIESLGYFLRPEKLFVKVVSRGNSNTDNFILEDLTGILRNIEQTTMGRGSENYFNDLFSDMDLNSQKLCRT